MVPRYLHKKIASNVIVMKREGKFNFNLYLVDSPSYYMIRCRGNMSRKRVDIT